MSIFELAIGLAEMTGLLIVACAAASWLRPRAPLAAANVGIAGLIFSLGLLIQTVVGLPHLTHTEFTFAAANQTHDAAREAELATPVPSESREHGIGLTVDRIASWISVSAQSDIQNDQPDTTTKYWFLALPTLALLPVGLGIIATIQLHRKSESVSKTPELASLLGDDQPFQFRASNQIHAPCVTFLFTWTIYLPQDWQSWSQGELRAAIAHESAHLQHRDPTKRFVSQLATALLCLHPLAIRLLRSVILSQEIAADMVAASSCPGDYLQNLSKLALRLDQNEHANTFLGTGIVSVSSSHLIRRIEMLTRQDAKMSEPTKLRWVPMGLVVGAFMLSASWTLKAEPPTTASPVERIARLEPTNGTQRFQRQSVAPWEQLNANDRGYISVNVEELLAHPNIAPSQPQLEKQLHLGWQVVAKPTASQSRSQLGLTTANLSQIIASSHVGFTKTKDEHDDTQTSSSITMGEKGAELRFKQPLVHDDVRNALDLEKILAVVDVKLEGEMTEQDWLQTFLDTFLSAGGVTNDFRLKQETDEETDQTQFRQLQRGWRAVEGGVVTACWTFPEHLGFIEDESDANTEMLFNQAACLGIGADIRPDSSQVHLRLALIPRDGVEVADLRAVLDHLVEFAEAEIADSNQKEEEVIEELEIARSLLQSHSISNQADCVKIEFELPMSFVAKLKNF